MPVLLDGGAGALRLFAATEQARGREWPKFRATDPDCIVLGLVNNMPDLALEQTERQVLQLLHDAAGHLVVCLRLYALTDVPRADLGRKHLRRLRYRDFDELRKAKLDGLIITGAEPWSADIMLEPYWDSLTRVFDWAELNTISTIASCMAVHAAVLHFDGIGRHPLNQKCFGVFDFERVSKNPLLDGVPDQFRMPHSRWNEIREDALVRSGYDIHVRADHAGVDMFTKLMNKSLFVFHQGHPEYEAWTLLGEYRRDVGRFLTGEQDNYPKIPEGYFDRESASLLDAFRDSVLNTRRKELMASFPSARLAGRVSSPWRIPAVKTYANWLQYIAGRKSERIRLTASLVGVSGDKRIS